MLIKGKGDLDFVTLERMVSVVSVISLQNQRANGSNYTRFLAALKDSNFFFKALDR